MPYKNYRKLDSGESLYIRSVLGMAHLNQYAIADFLHLSVPSVSRILSGTQSIEKVKYVELLNFLEDELLSAAHFFDDETSDDGYIRKSRIAVFGLFCNLISIEDLVSKADIGECERFVKECERFGSSMKKRYEITKY